MRAIVNVAPYQLAVQEIPLPEPGAGWVRIRSGACGICGTDIEMISGAERIKRPAILGHEWSGIVDVVGPGVDQDWVGARCVADNVLSDGKEVGFEYPGGFGEYFLTEARNLYRVPSDFSLVEATLIEPLAVAVRGFRRLRLVDRRNALVFGDGVIGLFMIWLLRAANVGRIVAVGGHDDRLMVATDFGANHIVNYHAAGDHLVDELLGIESGLFYNIVEASGSPDSMQASLDLATTCGHVLMLGDYGSARANFKWNQVLHKEIELIGSNASRDAWEAAVMIATSEEIPLHRLITHRFSPLGYEAAYQLARGKNGDVVKVVLEWIPDRQS